MPNFLTVPELANELCVDQSKILAWIHRGELLALNVAESATGRPRWRIPADAWQTFQQARSNQKAAASTSNRRHRTGTKYRMQVDT